MSTKIKNYPLKLGVSFLAGFFVFALIVSAGTINIPTHINNALQVIQRLLVTDDGTQSGELIMDINTGGSVIVYGSLLDGGNNPYLTGITVIESDPFWNAVSGDYYTTGAIDARGYLTGYTETDSLWNLEKSNYYTKSQINSGGYITTETDPLWSRDKDQYYTKTEINGQLAGAAGALQYRGARDYSSRELPSDVSKGDLYVINNLSGADFNGLSLKSPDQIIAKADVVGSTMTGDWDIIRYNALESDPVFLASDAFYVTSPEIIHWNTAFGRGNHTSAGYLTGGSLTNYYTQSQVDGLIGAISPEIIHGNTAFGRGNHTSAGYLTGGSLTNYYTQSQVDGLIGAINSPWIVSGTNYYYASGNIGVGIYSPTALLHLKAGTTAAGTAPLKFTDGPLMTNTEAGTIEYKGHTLYATTDLVRRSIVLAQEVPIADVVVANTGAEKTIYSIPMAANYLTPGKEIKTSLFGKYSSIGGANGVFTLRLKYNGVTIYTITSIAGAATDNPIKIEFTTVCRGIGAGIAGKIISFGAIYFTNEIPKLALGSLTNIDTTALNTIDLTIQYAAAKSNNVFTLIGGDTLAVDANN